MMDEAKRKASEETIESSTPEAIEAGIRWRDGGHREHATSSDGSSSDGGNDQEYSTSPIPDGGLHAWLQVFSGFMLYFNSWGLVTAFGVFQEFYNSQYLPPTVTNSQISWIGTLQGMLLAFTSVFAGCFLDRGHPRYLVLLGGFFVVLGKMMTSLCTEYWQLILAQGVCIGLGSGQLFIVAVASIPGWFSTKRAFATGLAATGSSLGGVVYPVVFHTLQPRLGFGWTVRIIGFISLGTILISLACVRFRTTPPSQPKIVDFSGFKEISFALFAVVSFVGAMGLYVPFFYVTEYATQRNGANSELGFYMLPILSAGSIIGRVGPAFLADKLGPLNILSATTAVSAVLAFCWMAVRNSVAGLIVWSILYGSFSGAFVSLQTPTVASITQDMKMVGGRMGMSNFALALGVLIGNPIAGALHGHSRWVGLQAFCGATLLISAILAILTRVQRTSGTVAKG